MEPFKTLYDLGPYTLCECLICGAVVTDKQVHLAWHERNIDTMTEES